MGSLRVFLSSTSDDLLEHRQAVRDAVLGFAHQPDDMQFWSADARGGAAHSLDRVRQADALVLIVAHRYGHVPAGSEYSITELEYRAAREVDLPVLAFFLDPDVAWPPGHVEWDAKDRLAAFRRLVESQVTRKIFRSADELARQVVQALALLAQQSQTRTGGRRLRHRVREVSDPARLTDEPDVLVPLGPAEDGLPLLLDVRRRRDLAHPLERLAQVLGSPASEAQRTLLGSLRRSLEETGATIWTAEGFEDVLTPDGPKRAYVGSFSLSQPFTSVLASLVSAPANGRVPRPRRPPEPSFDGAATTEPIPISDLVEHLRAELPSSGGSNRFLAVYPDDGRTSSVGRTREGKMIEWRPFVYETVLGAFPDAEICLSTPDGPRRDKLKKAPELLLRELADRPNDADACYGVAAWVEVSLEAAIRMVAAVGQELAALHGRGLVHADVKPHNVLAVETGPMLIDSFAVPAGQPAPGWTPGWSAPEQVLGRPVDLSADVYPLAVMVGRLLGGELVGEVRKYRTPRITTGWTEFDVFHDPLLFLDKDDALGSSSAVHAWSGLVQRGLRFDPTARPCVPDFVDELKELVENHPPSGMRGFRPSGRLTAVRLLDGTDAVARVVTDRRSGPAQPVAGRVRSPHWRGPATSA